MNSNPDASNPRALIVIAINSEVVAFRRTDGGVAWRQTFPSTVMGLTVKLGGSLELAFHGERIYVGARERIICLDYATGVIVGQVSLPDPVRRPCFLLEGDHLYVVGSKDLLCFTHDGQMVWQSPHGLAVLDGPAIGLPGNVRQGDSIGHS